VSSPHLVQPPSHPPQSARRGTASQAPPVASRQRAILRADENAPYDNLSWSGGVPISLRWGILIYRAFFDRFLLHCDAERSHSLARWTMRILATIPGVRRLLDLLLHPRDEGLRLKVMGLDFRSPFGLAAGVDKDATWYKPLSALGFGFVEIGTVTAQAQDGNPRNPRSHRRVSRLPADRALLNEMGFPNPGARVFARRLRRRPADIVVGVNIGKTKVVSAEDTVADYREAVRMLAPLADFLVINVSSPNTPGLTDWQKVDPLEMLITGIQKEIGDMSVSIPLLIKLGPDLANAELQDIADLALARRLDGIIAVNTSMNIGLASSSESEIAAAEHLGGVSGRPLRNRAIEVLEVLRERVGEDLTLISVGGIETPDDAWHRILAGASLVQAHTAFVYDGPLWPSRMNRGLSELLRSSPFNSIQEAIGAGAPGISRVPMATAQPSVPRRAVTAAPSTE
jgi:dihydroorotate dehydrogenase